MALDEKLREILNICPHYYEIVNCSFNKDDDLIKLMLDEYRTAIFDINSVNGGTTNRLRISDLVVYELTKKTDFYYVAKEKIKEEYAKGGLFVTNPLESLIVIYKNYLLNKTKEKEEEPIWL